MGAHKTGTTSLHEYLRQHPDVFLPALKEARFFSYNPDRPAAPASPYGWGDPIHPIRTWEQYQGLFAPVTTEKAIGETSPCYLNNPHAPGRVAGELPGVRLIASLRDPVDRAYSGYLMAMRSGVEQRPFMDVLREQPGWHGTLAYYEPCRRWLEHFPRERLEFIEAESLRARPAQVLRGLFEYLEVDPEFEADTSVQFHASGLPRSKRIGRLLSNRYVRRLRPHVPQALRGVLRPLRNANLRAPPGLPAEDRAALIALFRDDILRLQDLLDMDLQPWLQVQRRAPAAETASEASGSGGE